MYKYIYFLGLTANRSGISLFTPLPMDHAYQLPALLLSNDKGTVPAAGPAPPSNNTTGNNTNKGGNNGNSNESTPAAPRNASDGNPNRANIDSPYCLVCTGVAGYDDLTRASHWPMHCRG